MFLSTPPLHPTSNEVGFGQKTSSLTTPQPVQAAQTDGTSNTNFGQTSAGVTNVLGQGTSGQPSTTQDAVVVQSSPVVNPFGTLAAMPQTSIVCHGSTVIQYGISSMPVADNPVPAIVSSLLTSRHLSKRQFKLQARKYHPRQFKLQARKHHPKGDDQKVRIIKITQGFI